MPTKAEEVLGRDARSDTDHDQVFELLTRSEARVSGVRHDEKTCSGTLTLGTGREPAFGDLTPGASRSGRWSIEEVAVLAHEIGKTDGCTARDVGHS